MKLPVFLLVTLFAGSAFSQSGVLPFSGLTYSYHGLSAKELSVELTENTWTSNRLPIATEFEIRMVQPQGFALVEDKYYPGIEVAMLSLNGDTLGYIPDIMADGDFDGFEENTLKKLSVTLGFNELSKPGDTIVIHARFFDRNSDNDLETALNVIIAAPELPLDLAWSTFAVSSSAGYKGIAAGMDLTGMSAFQTASKKQEEKYDQYHIHADSLIGITPGEWEKGTLICSYYTDALKEISFPSDKVTVTKTVLSAENSSMNAAFVVPLFKDADMKLLRIRWENEDHTKVLDLVSDRRH